MAKSPKKETKVKSTKAKKDTGKESKAKSKRSKKAVAADDLEIHEQVDVDTNAFDIVGYMDSELQTIEKKTKTNADSMNRYAARVSTGQLALDMYLDGGIVPGGWYTFSGGEQSCKSTFTMSIMASVIRTKFRGLALVHDYEGSTDADYVSNQLECFGVKINAQEVFGVQDEETGEWLVRPAIRYYSPSNGEAYFNYMGMLRRSLPDKVVDKNGEAYYIFENNKVNAKRLKGKYDTKWFSTNNQFKVPAPDAEMQVLSIVDSYPAMLPDSQDQDDPSGAMAVQARMFSDGIKRFRGGMRRKMITVVGVNQLRQKPATMFGSPEYEPCGDALKFYCFAGDTLLNTSTGRRAAKEIFENSNGQMLELESIDGLAKSIGIRIVEEARTPAIINAAGHTMTVSDLHRTHTLQESQSSTGQVVRAEYQTAHQILSGSEGRTFASLRMAGVDEVDQRADIDAVRRSLFSRVSEIRMKYDGEDQAPYQADRYVSDLILETDANEIVRDLLYAGVHAYVIPPRTLMADSYAAHVIIPAAHREHIWAAINPNLATTGEGRVARKSFQEYQRDLAIRVAVYGTYPELVEALDDYEIQDEKLYLHRPMSCMEAMDAVLYGGIDPTPRLNSDTYDSLIEALAYIEEYFNVDEALVPTLVTDCRIMHNEETTLYDVCVPATNAVVTNGILSHNSDVRVRLASRAIPAGWKGEQGIVSEKSVTVDNGIDRYRFVAGRTIKNKLGGVPNQTTWFRLWESDGKGKARGFDPVFDTYHYLKTLNLVSGTRNRIKFEKPCPLHADKAKAIDWDQFRTLINGTKAQIVEVCNHIGCKPAGLRLWCFKFVQSNRGKDLLRSVISSNGKTVADEE